MVYRSQMSGISPPAGRESSRGTAAPPTGIPGKHKLHFWLEGGEWGVSRDKGMLFNIYEFMSVCQYPITMKYFGTVLSKKCL